MVRDKDRANFCTFFSFRFSDRSSDSPSAPGPGTGKTNPDKARKKLDKLFGNDS